MRLNLPDMGCMIVFLYESFKFKLYLWLDLFHVRLRNLDRSAASFSWIYGRVLKNVQVALLKQKNPRIISHQMLVFFFFFSTFSPFSNENLSRSIALRLSEEMCLSLGFSPWCRFIYSTTTCSSLKGKWFDGKTQLFCYLTWRTYLKKKKEESVSESEFSFTAFITVTQFDT